MIVIAVTGFIVGCTAIIDGTEGWPAGDGAVEQGASPGRGDALLDAGGADSPPSLGSGGAVELAGGGFRADAGGSPASSSRAGEGGQLASAAGGASAGGRADELGQAGAGGADGTAGESPGSGGVPAAGSSGAAGSGNSGGGVGGPAQPLVGDPAKGHKILVLDNCYRCHGDNLAGRSFYPNITPDIETGIGAWTDKQISTAIRGAIGPDGEIFCATMPLYSGFKPQEVADLIAFLRIVPAVKSSIVAVCPGHDP